MRHLHLNYSLLVIFTVFVSLLFAQPTETQNDVETHSTAPAPIEQPPLTCANVTCPKDSVTCMYTESTTEDLNSIHLNSTCTGKNGEILYSDSKTVPNDSKGYKFLQISHSVGGNLQTIGDFGGFDGFADWQREIDDVWSTFRNVFNSTFFQHNLWNPFTRPALGHDRNEALN